MKWAAEDPLPGSLARFSGVRYLSCANSFDGSSGRHLPPRRSMERRRFPHVQDRPLLEHLGEQELQRPNLLNIPSPRAPSDDKKLRCPAPPHVRDRSSLDGAPEPYLRRAGSLDGSMPGYLRREE